MEASALRQRLSGSGTAVRTQGGWKLTLPPGDDKTYRLAQLDDYGSRARSKLPWRGAGTLRLRARVSATSLPGTWGFGFWNDPFGAACDPTGLSLRLPALPHAVWYFAASPKSYLSLRDDAPAQGFLAQAYGSPRFGLDLLQVALGATISLAAARQKLALIIQEAALGLSVDARAWHTYEIAWNTASTEFGVDTQTVFRTPFGPRAPLGFLVWIDNQFARFDPQGRLAWGLEASGTESSLEIADLNVSAPR